VKLLLDEQSTLIHKYKEDSLSDIIMVVNKLLKVMLPIFLILIFSSISTLDIAKAQTPSYSFVTSWGTEGSEEGQFDGLNDVHVFDGFAYVPDYNNNRVQKFTSDGQFITAWGTKGEGDGQFDSPAGIDIDNQDRVYVTDRGNSRIEVFDNTGQFITSWGTPGSENGQFARPEGINVDMDGNVYVADTENARVQKFAPSDQQ